MTQRRANILAPIPKAWFRNLFSATRRRPAVRRSRAPMALALSLDPTASASAQRRNARISGRKGGRETTTVAGFTRKRPERNTFPDHPPRERVVIDPPTACACRGGKLGEDVTRTLEPAPRKWKVIETVRGEVVVYAHTSDMAGVTCRAVKETREG